MFDVMEDDELCPRRDEKRKNKTRQEKVSCNPRGVRLVTSYLERVRGFGLMGAPPTLFPFIALPTYVPR
jgi:hypothetical protein